MKSVKYFIGLIQNLYFIMYNIHRCRSLRWIPSHDIDLRYNIIPCIGQSLQTVEAVYSMLSDDMALSKRNRMLFMVCGRKLVFVLYDKVAEKIIGVEFYYFNKRDINENTIHQGFRGILPEYQGKGLGTALTQYAYDIFSKTSLKGMSTRVSCNNLSSLISNKKIGFEPVEKYFDSSMNEERYYMICKF